ncbi:MAG: hypothetical protein JXR70_17730 [Spirochaetales bacterium]|nr:hypothetical protein [Spirochaetales bacterium]
MKKEKKQPCILAIKKGYNPNSSSVGSDLPAFLFFVLAAGGVGVFVANLISYFQILFSQKKVHEEIQKK